MENKVYRNNVLRTESSSWHGESATLSALDTVLEQTIGTGNLANALKRAVFYGKGEVLTGNPTRIADVDNLNASRRLLHALLGVVSEAAELAEAYLTFLNTGILDATNAGEEIGDLHWYLEVGADAIGMTTSGIRERNIAKLKARFPEKFTEEDADVRNLEAEREALEQEIGEVAK